ncbi:MAG: hypothetical protein FJZ00_04100, partial [Candidatus Sericytochromatia bacterium]|nr:hypothetical protein [Candidatus Tanganyikabacteria bacterium]
DLAAGKRTLAARFGPRPGAAIVRASLLLAYLNLLPTAAFSSAPWIAVLPVLTAGRALRIARGASAQAPASAFGPLLGSQTRLIAEFAGLLAVAVLLS